MRRLLLACSFDAIPCMHVQDGFKTQVQEYAFEEGCYLRTAGTAMSNILMRLPDVCSRCMLREVLPKLKNPGMLYNDKLCCISQCSSDCVGQQ